MEQAFPAKLVLISEVESQREIDSKCMYKRKWNLGSLKDQVFTHWKEKVNVISITLEFQATSLYS